MFVPALVLIFLLRLRFPRNQPIPTVINRRYGRATTACFRKLEKTTKQFHKASLDLDFLLKCNAYNVFPKFLRFKLYRKCLHNTSLYKNFQQKLLDNEISFKKHRIEILKTSVNTTKNSLKEKLSFIDFNVLNVFIDNVTTKFCNSISEIHKRKLINLGGHYNLTSCKPDDVVFNLSDYCLSEKEKFLLSFGLNFCLPIMKLKFSTYFLSFESLVYRLKQQSIHYGKDVTSVIRELKCTAYKYFNKFKQGECPIFKKDDVQVLINLGKNRNIIISKPDKGNGVVIQNRTDYVQKMMVVLSDSTKFKKVPHTDPFHQNLLIEDKINRFLSNLKKEGIISESEYTECYASGRSPGTLYGLPKIHKPNTPLRPVLAAYNMPSYNLAKFLVPFLNEIINSSYSLKNSYQLIEELKNVIWTNDCFICSFDVTSLFTNIPLNETIEIAVNEMYKENGSFRNLSKNKFKMLLELVSKDTYFLFNNELFKQIDGVAMGSPISSTFANLFLGYHEAKWLEDCPLEFKPLLYKRYVDDTFAIFRRSEHATKFLNYLNSKHSNIKFTIEKERDHQIPFLDILINKTDKTLSIYRKPTFSGLGTSFLSHCPNIFKINAIRTLVFRAYEICSSYLSLHKELEFLHRFFNNNGFPSHMVHKEIKKFLDGKYRPDIPTLTAPKMDFYCKMPYIGKQVSKLEKDLKACLSKYYPQINFKFIFHNNYKIGNLFPFKDRLPNAMRASIVYLYKCPNCQVGYLGSSLRTLKTRYCQHAGESERTGRDLSVKLQSPIREHSHDCQTRLDINHFKIIDTCPNQNDLRILESIYIKRYKPQLNHDQSSVTLYIADYNHFHTYSFTPVFY